MIGPSICISVSFDCGSESWSVSLSMAMDSGDVLECLLRAC